MHEAVRVGRLPGRTPADRVHCAMPTLALTADRRTLARGLARAERAVHLRAIALVVPLFVFLLGTFLLPIGALLSKSVVDKDVARILPRVTATLHGWEGNALPPEDAYRALAEDIRAAREAGTLASAATRLNYDVTGYRSLMFVTGRQLPVTFTDGAKETLIGIDPKWGTLETWGAIKRASGPVTDFFLLAALDLKRDAAGGIGQERDDETVFRTILGRTLWIAGVVTLACLLLGYPVAHYLSAQSGRKAAILLFLVLLPFWTSLLVRTVAWVVLLQREGVVNDALLGLGLVTDAAEDDLQPVRGLRGDGARAAAVHDPAAVQRDEGDPARVSARRSLARCPAPHRMVRASTCPRRYRALARVA